MAINKFNSTTRIAMEKANDEAIDIIESKDKFDELIVDLERKLKLVPQIGEQLSHIPVFVSMIKSYIINEYTKVPTGTILAMIAAIVYFISPVDAISDFIPVLGYSDDIFVWTACLNLVEGDIRDYIQWRKCNGNLN